MDPQTFNWLDYRHLAKAVTRDFYKKQEPGRFGYEELLSVAETELAMSPNADYAREAIHGALVDYVVDTINIVRPVEMTEGIEQFTAAVEAARNTTSILHTEATSTKAPESQGSARNCAAETRGPPLRRVREAKGGRPRIHAPHGLSHHERNLLTESFNYMQQWGPGVFISIEAGRSRDAERIVRGLTRRIRSDIAQCQRRAGMQRVLSITVFEALGRDKQPKFGAHIVAVMPNATARDRLIERLNGSTAYGKNSATVLAKPVTNWRGLPGYLLKEATPQAWHGAGKSFRRLGGSIPLGDLGGNRVILSNDLRDALLRAGRIEPSQRTYAKRLPKTPKLSAKTKVRLELAGAA
jgi:hypothetical protein